jgi:hypothetical protein
MPSTARYIEEMTDQLSRLANQDGMRDLAYLLRMASEEAQAVVERITTPATPDDSAVDHG